MTTTDDDSLVSTDWLAAHLDDPRIKVIDASYKMPGVRPLPAEDFLAAHLPGAVFFDVNAIADPDDPRPHMYPKAEQFARDVAALGISSDDTIVAYDSGAWVAAPRAWWMFLSFGHANIKVLDGGLQKWTAEGRSVESGAVTPKPGKFQARLDPGFVRSKEQLLGNLESRKEQLVDARPRPRFEGTVAEPLDELRKAFAAAGVDTAKPIVTTCGSGVSALVLTLALYRLGVRGTALYDGSWAEWGLPDGPPLATGPA